MTTAQRTPRSELRGLLGSLRRHAWTVALFSGTSNLLMLAPTLYMLQVYDRVLVSQSITTLVFVSLVTLFFLAFMSVAEGFRSRMLVHLGVHMDTQLSPRVFEAQVDARRKAPASTQGNALGDLLELRQFLTGNGMVAFLDAPWTPIYLAILFLLHPWMGLIGCAFVLAQAALARWGHRQALAPSKALQQAQRDSQELLTQQLQQVDAVYPMGLWGRLRARWESAHAHYMQAHARSHRSSHAVQAWSKWVRYSQQSLSLAAGAWLVLEGKISLGAMIAANVLTTRALAPVDQMVSLWQQWLSAADAYRRLDALLSANPGRSVTEVHPPLKGLVQLRGVSAFAPGREAPILRSVDLELQPGTVTVVLGPSGCGKSTLARVMLGVWPQVEGDVLLDGIPVDKRDREAMGPSIGYLPQSVELFGGSIAQNIARHGQTDPGKVVEASRQADLHALILRMPQGYDTAVGDYGERLSGGQRQRIGLARALYGDPALIVLDEPNAHLDDAGEAALAQAVEAMRKRGQTVFLITHRPGVVALADRIMLMRDGQIEWQGPRNDAIRRMSSAAILPSAPPAEPPAPAKTRS